MISNIVGSVHRLDGTWIQVYFCWLASSCGAVFSGAIVITVICPTCMDYYKICWPGRVYLYRVTTAQSIQSCHNYLMCAYNGELLYKLHAYNLVIYGSRALFMVMTWVCNLYGILDSPIQRNVVGILALEAQRNEELNYSKCVKGLRYYYFSMHLFFPMVYYRLHYWKASSGYSI